jgi:hypothetical protein
LCSLHLLEVRASDGPQLEAAQLVSCHGLWAANCDSATGSATFVLICEGWISPDKLEQVWHSRISTPMGFVGMWQWWWNFKIR